jgi:uncharacterized protein YdcH (DUF465 family)
MTEQDEKALKAELMNSEPEFRSLVRKHEKLESRLTELNRLQFPTDKEKEEEQNLKRDKLIIKDQIQSFLNSYQETTVSS